MKDLFKQFNLPSYTMNKSFAGASKAIQDRFKDRKDKDSKATEMELLGRLRDAQEYVKQQEEQEQQMQAQQQGMPQEAPQGMPMQGMDPMAQQGQFAFGGYSNHYAMGGMIDPDPTDPPSVKLSPERQRLATQAQDQGAQLSQLRQNSQGLYTPERDLAYQRGMAKVDHMKKMRRSPGQIKRFQNEIDRAHAINMQRATRKADVANFQNNPQDLDNRLAEENIAQQRATQGMQGSAQDNQLRQAGYQGYAMGGYSNTNDYFLGGMFGGGQGQQQAPTAKQQANRNNGIAIGSAIGSGFANNNKEQMELLDEDEQARQNQWESTKDGVASAIPIAGLFRGVEKMGKGLGQSIGGDEGGDFATGFLDPISNVSRKDTSVGEKALSVLDPVVSGFITAKKNKKRRERAQRAQTQKIINQMDNSYADGGYTNRYHDGGPIGHSHDDMIDYGAIDNTFSGGQDPRGQEASIDGANEVEYKKAKGTKVKDALGKAGEWGKDNYANIMRYAPAMANAYQLATLKKPDQESLSRLDRKYQRQLVDEQQMQNVVRDQSANFRSAILNSSGGSAGAARANLLASQANSTRAMSSAYARAADANRAENRAAQQFDAGTDRVNLQQSNMEKDINAKNKGNYDTQKSKLIAALGDNIGGIGQEEYYKKYPEMLGMYYDHKGRLVKTPEQKKKEKESKNKK